MSHSKFSLADVLSLITAFAFGFVCFLSLNFLSLGDNMVKSITISVVTVLLLWGTAFGLKLIKRTNSNFKVCIIWEWLLLVFLTFATLIFSIFVFSHYFNVSQQSDNIQSELDKSIIQAQKMFNSYEDYASNRENLYERKLRSVANTKYTNPSQYLEYGFEMSPIPDASQIETKMFTIHAELFPTNYSDSINGNGIKEIATLWLNDAKNKVSTWSPLGIVSIVNDIDKNSREWLNALIQQSSFRLKGELTEDFSYQLSFNDIKTQFTTTMAPTLMSIVLSILCYVLLLFSYLRTRRDSRFPGLKLLFRTRETSINEL